MPPVRPKVIVVASSKGGQGKSVITAALAVQAVKDGARVALIDWEAQGSLTMWWRLRGRPDNPTLQPSTGDIARDIAELRETDAHWVLVDTPPDHMVVIERAIVASDFVLIPSRVSVFDLGGVRAVIGFCQHHKKPFAFVLNAVNPDQAGWPALIKSAVAALKKFGPVLPKMIRERAAYISALNSGRSGPESSLTRQAKDASVEIAATWTAVKRLAAGKARAGR